VTVPVEDLWNRAKQALLLANHDLSVSADGSATWAYYAAFCALSALFGLRGRSFTKHSALETAVHRDLVKNGHWPAHLASEFTRLAQLREVGHYGGPKHVTPDEAKRSIESAAAILRAVAAAHPEAFKVDETA
jgi:uncharacterized protein (UPF0332 family)